MTRINLLMEDVKGQTWSHQFGKMWANTQYKYVTSSGNEIPIPTGRIIRHFDDIRSMENID